MRHSLKTFHFLNSRETQIIKSSFVFSWDKQEYENTHLINIHAPSEATKERTLEMFCWRGRCKGRAPLKVANKVHAPSLSFSSNSRSSQRGKRVHLSIAKGSPTFFSLFQGATCSLLMATIHLNTQQPPRLGRRLTFLKKRLDLIFKKSGRRKFAPENQRRRVMNPAHIIY